MDNPTGESMDKMRAKLEVIRDLATNCPGHFWEETVAMIRDEADAALQPSAWISCAERLPTEADADPYGGVWTYTPGALHEVSQGPYYVIGSTTTHWMPTGLTRPQPPEEK